MTQVADADPAIAVVAVAVEVAVGVAASYACVQDPSRSCGGCSVSTGPANCPYLYLIDETRH